MHARRISFCWAKTYLCPQKMCKVTIFESRVVILAHNTKIWRIGVVQSYSFRIFQPNFSVLFIQDALLVSIGLCSGQVLQNLYSDLSEGCFIMFQRTYYAQERETKTKLNLLAMESLHVCPTVSRCLDELTITRICDMKPKSSDKHNNTTSENALITFLLAIGYFHIFKFKFFA